MAQTKLVMRLTGGDDDMDGTVTVRKSLQYFGRYSDDDMKELLFDTYQNLKKKLQLAQGDDPVYNGGQSDGNSELTPEFYSPNRHFPAI